LTGACGAVKLRLGHALEKMKEKIKAFREFFKRYEGPAFFTAGFLFDVFTLRRIDDWLKLGFQILFIILLGVLIFFEYREATRQQPVPPFLTKIWKYQIEIVHFLFGSMLSAFVIFYFKSASLTRSVTFFLLLVILMFLNEFPKVRRYGVRLRAALYSFCLTSFFVYFLPVLFGFLSPWLFLVAIVLSVGGTAALVFFATRGELPEIREKNAIRLGLPALLIQLIMVTSYFLKVIPPVPLSMTFGGIYHKVEKDEAGIKLYSLKPWYNFWSHGDRTFQARAGDVLYCFVRIFAPARFGHTVYLHWYLYDEHLGQYVEQDKIPMEIHGGREEGFRGYAYKSHYQPGDWRVDVETSDERVIGDIGFSVVADPSSDERVWMIEQD
jgi:hypothetical protein